MFRLCVWIFFFSGYFSVNANMRQSYQRSSFNSGIINASSSGFEVKKEILNFFCESPYSGDLAVVRKERRYCNIEAKYFVETSQELSLDLEFILPHFGSIVYKTAPESAAALATGIADARPVNPDTYNSLLQRPFEIWSNNQEYFLYAADFSVTLRKGNNLIMVSYSVPLDVSETSHGYFTGSKWSSGVGYELWPLKQWTLAQDFMLEINAGYKKSGGFSSMVFKKDIKLLGAMKSKGEIQKFAAKDCRMKDKYFICSFNLSRNFPDRIFMEITE